MRLAIMIYIIDLCIYLYLYLYWGPCHSSGVLPRKVAFSRGCHRTYMVDEGMCLSPRFFGVFPS